MTVLINGCFVHIQIDSDRIRDFNKTSAHGMYLCKHLWLFYMYLYEYSLFDCNSTFVLQRNAF